MVRSTRRLLRPRHRRSGGFLSTTFLVALALGILARPGAAQQPTRPDTTRRAPPDTAQRAPADTTHRATPDTSAAARDTGRARTPRDTTPPPQLPELPRPVLCEQDRTPTPATQQGRDHRVTCSEQAGFSTGTWVFDRQAIERLGTALTLADLLERIPGVVRLHAGYLIQPDAVATLGQTAGRTQVFLDGYELAPLAGGVVDLSRIELAEVSEVRVERRLGVLRIELTSLSPSTPQPYAYIEALIAQPNSKLFRGVFLSPRFLIGPVAFGVERLDTDGTHRAEPGDEFSAWGKWSRIWRNKGGFQAEYRTSTLHRDASAATVPLPWVGGLARTDWTVRGRWQFFPGVVAEAYFGSTSLKDTHLVPAGYPASDTGMAVPLVVTVPAAPQPLTASSTHQDTVNYNQAVAARNAALQAAPDTLLDVSDHQIGGRLGILHGPFWADAAVRTHSAPRLPGAEGDATVGLVVPRIGDVDGGVHLEKWTSPQVTETRLRGRLGPAAGFSAFGELTSGQRGVPFLSDNSFLGTADSTLFTRRSGWRAGVYLERSWISGGIARVSVTTDSLPGLGLPFDPSPAFHPSGSMQGWESHGRLQLFWKPLSAEFWYVAWTQFKFPPQTDSAAAAVLQPVYVPDQQWRASLVYHQSPLPSGHLELYARLDGHSRGVMYDAVRPTTQVPALTDFDFYLQIRIMDLRIYFENRGMTRKPTDHVTDFLAAYGRDVPAPRILYGVRWQFFD